MSSPATLPLSNIVNVIVEVSPIAPPVPTFNQGLIVGSSPVIPSFGGINNRIRQYQSTAAMLSDGFSTNSPEYIAAQIYFSQSPAPQFLWVGRQDLTSIAAIAVGASGGTGYSVGDLLTVVEGGASAGIVKVDTVSGGVVTGVEIVQDGTGYTVSNNNATTGGTGTGCQINITAIGETPLVAIQACRAASFQWWGCMATTAVTADHEAIAAWIQTASPVGFYFFSTSDNAALSGVAGNVFSVLKAAAYNRVLGLYSTTQGGAFPNNIYAAAAVMGTAMGLNTGLANSAYTLKFKQLVGVAIEPLTLTSIGIIEGNNGNVYLNYANVYTFLEQGRTPSGQFFDEIINLDMLSSAIQFNIMNLLTENPKLPQNNAGQTQLIHAVNQACEASRVIGFLGPGQWNGVTVLNLSQGDNLPNGYLVQSPPYSQQSTSDRQARKSMPIYAAILEAGAVHSVVVGVFVQR